MHIYCMLWLAMGHIKCNRPLLGADLVVFSFLFFFFFLFPLEKANFFSTVQKFAFSIP